ncbi:hypothetical protein RND81_07G009700 [Saponaria officinalis]|uniref:WRKY domain-containing protein n=1 Tax=Saponaria officinalis TaxID=3572 RepID=A0AAW1JK09_SAPOF
MLVLGSSSVIMESTTPTSPLPSSLYHHQQVSKKRKVDEKTVVRVKLEANRGDQPPSDSWSWRKYGQKPIRGSPYPRCSTAKGCTAKKQVDRCKDDASHVVITYTSPHNHPPKHSTTHVGRSPTETQPPIGKVEEEHEPYVVTLDTCPPLPTTQPTPPPPDDEEEAEDESYDFYEALHDLPFSSIPSFTSFI